MRVLLPAAIVFNLLILVWTIWSFLPICCVARPPPFVPGMKGGFFSFLVFVGWITAFPLSFFKAKGKLISTSIFLFVGCVAIIKYGFGLMSLEPLLALVIGLAIALYH